ncbi:hypothetical protein BDY17DRAFT_189000 [Neohortaea acidophila]|uniref:HAUS augmin-like complex subunit 1 n=1 Tax=Neohortaea acidophila TaxID=245834 RepID=A0A6A6PMX5_9PEZI|nr:uncharacterized protein BDY17DRAFT_189000 [Neohortaea acidophila]KAF2481458.1 hypothetical protein BDY17DRAFT_189000 [Neohortaea acidophila]
MDQDGEWAAETLFSPSKARVQQAQAKDWAVVDAWLSKKYASKQLPAFERNEETLQALLTLANVHENADEQRSYLDRIEKAALAAYNKRNSNTDEVYQLLMKSIAGKGPELGILAESAVTLDCPNLEVSTMVNSAVDLTARAFETEQQVRRVDAQLELLKVQHDQATKQLGNVNNDAFSVGSELAEESANWARSAKNMRAKIAEYDERLHGVASPRSSQAQFDSLRKAEEQLEEERRRLGQLGAQLKAFQSLPPDRAASRAMVENARARLHALTEERDRRFEQLAGAD